MDFGLICSVPSSYVKNYLTVIATKSSRHGTLDKAGSVHSKVAFH